MYLSPTLTWGSFTSISLFTPYAYDLLTRNSKGITPDYSLFTTIRGEFYSVLPCFLSNQRYFTLFLSAFLSAEEFLYNYSPVFSQILHLLLSHSNSTAYPQHLHGILSTAYPRITSITLRLF